MGRDTKANTRATDPDRIQIHLGGHAGLVEDLAYRRAKAAQAALLNAGVDVMRIEFVKPEVVEGGGDLAEARRVEVSIK